MKKWFSVLICSIILTALCFYFPATAQEPPNPPTLKQRSEPLPLSDELSSILSTSGKTKIPVMIRFRDDYDEARIEEEAMIEASNTKSTLSSARNLVLSKHVKEARESFMKSAGISPEDVESYCSLIPLISLAWLSPEHIKQLTLHPDVLGIEYIDTTQKTETFAIDGATSIGGNFAPSNDCAGAGIRIGIIDTGHPNLSFINGNNYNTTVVEANV